MHQPTNYILQDNCRLIHGNCFHDLQRRQCCRSPYCSLRHRSLWKTSGYDYRRRHNHHRHLCSVSRIPSCKTTANKVKRATANAMPQFMGGRFLLGFGVSYCCIAAPTYVSELAHPKVSNKIMTMRKVTNGRLVERYSYGLLQLHVVCTHECFIYDFSDPVQACWSHHCWLGHIRQLFCRRKR